MRHTTLEIVTGMLLHEDWRTAPPDANKTIEFWQAAYRCGASMCFESSRIDVRHVGEAPNRRRNARNRFIVSPGLIRKPWSVVRTCKRPRSVQVSEPPERLRSERTHRRPSGLQHGALNRFTALRPYPHRPSGTFRARRMGHLEVRRRDWVWSCLHVSVGTWIDLDTSRSP